MKLMAEYDKEVKIRNLEENTTVVNDCLERVLINLQEEFQVMFLSDLHTPIYRYKILRYLSTIDINRYPLQVWNKLLSYITHEKMNLQTELQVMSYLRNNGIAKNE